MMSFVFVVLVLVRGTGCTAEGGRGAWTTTRPMVPKSRRVLKVPGRGLEVLERTPLPMSLLKTLEVTDHTDVMLHHAGDAILVVLVLVLVWRRRRCC